MTGMSESSGISTAASLRPGRPMKDSPIMPDRPSPRIVNASPVATWLATSVSVRKPNSSENSMPATSPPKAPNPAEPVSCAMAKAATAPMIIMPSRPRLRTPERSTTKFADRGQQQRRGCGDDGQNDLPGSCPSGGTPFLRRAENQPDTVVDQRVAAQNEEQEQALEQARHLVGDADRNLRRLAAQVGQGQNKAGLRRSPAG